MRTILRRLSLFTCLSAIVFLAEVFCAMTLLAVSDTGWDRSTWVVAFPLFVAVMIVAAALAAHFSIVLARRFLLSGFQARLDRIEDARSESHRQLATMAPAFAMLLGGLDSQRRLIDGLRAQLLPATEQLAAEKGPLRAARAPMLNALSLAAGLARETTHRFTAAKEMRDRLSRAEQAHGELLHELRELQEVFDTMPGMAVDLPHPAPVASVKSVPHAASAPAPALADLLEQATKTKPQATVAAVDQLPPALRARLQQPPLTFGDDDLGLN